MAFSRREFLAAASAASLAATRLRAQTAGADLVLFNGVVITVDDAFSIRQAVAVKDGKILAVGGNELRNRYAGARMIDLRGRTLIPGFFDTHIHIAGHSRRFIDFGDTTSLEQLKQQVSEKARELGPGEWITGADWDEYRFTEQRKPLRGDLDAAAPNNPIVITRAGGHSAVGNSKALQMADINAATPDP